jgi:hypothetical protein
MGTTGNLRVALTGMNKRTRARTAAIVIGVLFGLATGIGGSTFIYARAGSYLTNNPNQKRAATLRHWQCRPL